MLIYIKLGKVRGLAVEIQKEFGRKPFFLKKSFDTETIIDIPYTQLVYTPSNWYPIRKASNGNNKTGQASKSFGGID